MKKAKKKKKKKLYGPSFDEKRQYILSLSFLSHSITSPSSIQDLPIKYILLISHAHKHPNSHVVVSIFPLST